MDGSLVPGRAPGRDQLCGFPKGEGQHFGRLHHTGSSFIERAARLDLPIDQVP
jgi:hypothetical protein